MKRIFTLLALALLFNSTLWAQTETSSTLPLTLNGGEWRAGHIQGVAVDSTRKYIYLSFTTLLVKMDMQGNVIGTVTGLIGHLGCLEFNDADGRLYGSLEYKNDAIGRPILERENAGRAVEDGFYVAIFDVDKIDREGMNAERDKVMTTVFLSAVLEDYKASVTNAGRTFEHRFGCSGFDGISFGPRFGKGGRNDKPYLTIAYGIYTDLDRTDNDYQVLLQYDTSDWARYETPISQNNIHRNGPSKPDGRYFVRTGNTNWGVQQLEYDHHSGLWLLGTYKGRKPQFAPLTLFAIDAGVAPRRTKLEGVDYVGREQVLTLVPLGEKSGANGAIRGWRYDCAVGLCSLGDGDFFVAKSKKRDGMQSGIITRMRFTPDDPARPFAAY
jgi:hypothetical protein